MHQHIKFVLAATLLLGTSCVPSINPIFTDRDLVFDQSIVGKWADPGSTETWEFFSSNEKEYRLIHTDENGKTGAFSARLANLRGKTFLDIVPARREKTATEFYEDHFFETHTFVLIEKRDSAVLISYLEPKWLKDHLAAKPKAVEHLVVDGEILLTDSTKKLQRFVSDIVEEKGAFSEPSEIRRVSAGKSAHNVAVSSAGRVKG